MVCGDFFFFFLSKSTHQDSVLLLADRRWLAEKERQIFALFSVSNRQEKCFPCQWIKDFASQCKKKQVKISSRARVDSKKNKIKK